ncbi:MAG: ThuA domain-containing protein [Planctomycetota bacterium]|jgi:hypothetical protein
MRLSLLTGATALAAAVLALPLAAQQDKAAATQVVYQGSEGVGLGKHVVFITGDEEYRSEECMPQLARILAFRHGFQCTVLFAIDPETGAIDPGNQKNVPGLAALDEADLMVVFTRFRDLPDEEMEHFVRYVESGRPVIGLRTATHAFDIPDGRTYRRYSWRNPEWKGGFGQQILGETWVAHHGGHGWQSTRGVVADGAAEHPILRGFEPGTVWDPSDVYTIRMPLPEDAQTLLNGEVLAGMSPGDEAAGARTLKDGKVFHPNEPMMPVAWTRSVTAPNGETARVFSTTLGAAEAFAHAGTRRLLVNATLWALGMEDAIEPDLDVACVGTFEPSKFGFGKHKQGVMPADLAWPVEDGAAAADRGKDGAPR